MENVLQTLWVTIKGGGVVMIALALLSLALYRSALGTYFFIKKTVAGSGQNSVVHESPELFREEFDDIVKRQITFIGVLATAAPLLGLLGTVEGMLATFDSLAQRTSTDTSRRVSGGVSMALITTQAGLLIAIPALFMIQLIKREANKVEYAISSILLAKTQAERRGPNGPTISK